MTLKSVQTVTRTKIETKTNNRFDSQPKKKLYKHIKKIVSICNNVKFINMNNWKTFHKVNSKRYERTLDKVNILSWIIDVREKDVNKFD